MMNEALKKTISNILSRALAGYTDDYKHTVNGQIYIRWGLVEQDIHKAIDDAIVDDRDVPIDVSSDAEDRYRLRFG